MCALDDPEAGLFSGLAFPQGSHQVTQTTIAAGGEEYAHNAGEEEDTGHAPVPDKYNEGETLDYEIKERLQHKEKKLLGFEKSILDHKQQKVYKQYPDRPNQEKQTLYVHMVAHSHLESGWKKTLEQYYSGTNQGADVANVEIIFTGSYSALMEDPKRRITFAEIKYFHMWYTRQDKTVQEGVKKLVSEGRIEFANGGWTASDEASPNYEDMINNMLQGHQFLRKEFGVTPTVGWMLDSYGHSSTNARLFADLGFEALFIARHDKSESVVRKPNKSYDFLWRPYEKHFGNEKQILTSIFSDGYCFAPYFHTTDDFIDDDPTLRSFNAEEKMQDFIHWLHTDMLKVHQGNHIILPWGCDFHFQNAEEGFSQTDKVINYFNKHNKANIKLLYSTPSYFISELKQQNLEWPVQYNDMFPYSDHSNDFYSGMYSSRPGFKKHIKDGSSALHASSKLLALRAISQSTTDAEIAELLKVEDELLDIMGVVQDHHAIAGTTSEFVTDDYRYHLGKAMSHSQQVYQKALGEIMTKTTGIQASELLSCEGSANDTVLDCPVSHNAGAKEFVVVVHNPVGGKHQQIARIRLPSNRYTAKVFSLAKKAFVDVDHDIIEQKHLQNRTQVFVDYELFVPINFGTSQVQYLQISAAQQPHASVAHGEAKRNLTIEGFSDVGDVMMKYQNGNLSQHFGFNLKYYRAHQVKDYRQAVSHAAGAYLFKPDLEHLHSYQYSALTTEVEYEQGSIVDQWTIRFWNCTTEEAAIVKIRFLEKYEEFIEFEVELIDVPLKEGYGKDVTVNWKLFDGFNANKTFWTDSNGLEMQERRLNYNPSYPWNAEHKDTQNISGNFYPVSSAIAIRDNAKKLQATIMNDRAQAGSADLEPSTIELIQHRRMVQDDNRGPKEILNETDSSGNGIKVNARYWMQIFDMKVDQSKQREQQLVIQQPLQYFYGFNTSLVEGARGTNNLHETKKEDLTSQLNYQAFPIAKNKILVRMENIQDLFDGVKQSSFPGIDMNSFAQQLYEEANAASCSPSSITISETSPSGMPLTNRFAWRGKGDAAKPCAPQASLDKGNVRVLRPQDIRSFYITYNENQPKSSAPPAQAASPLQPIYSPAVAPVTAPAPAPATPATAATPASAPATSIKPVAAKPAAAKPQPKEEDTEEDSSESEDNLTKQSAAQQKALVHQTWQDSVGVITMNENTKYEKSKEEIATDEGGDEQVEKSVQGSEFEI